MQILPVCDRLCEDTGRKGFVVVFVGGQRGGQPGPDTSADR